MDYADRPDDGQRVNCACDSRLITTIRRPTGPAFSVFLGKE